MAKAEKKPAKKEKENYQEKVGIKGDFLEVFKVVKKDKEKRLKEGKKGK